MKDIKEQKIWNGASHMVDIAEEMQRNQIEKVMLVCGRSYEKIKDILQIEKLPVQITYFSEFTPNPEQSSVTEGIKRFLDTKSDAILAVGGGSALDVAKCIKAYAYAPEKYNEKPIKLFAVPTTAGSGSEATGFAAIYKEGVKYSAENEGMFCDYVLFEGAVLDTLPLYQKKATALDALCHAVESCWSVCSNEESLRYAEEAIQIILKNLPAYIEKAGNRVVNMEMLRAANLAGKAIHIAKTTAGHALSYKISSMYHIAHGHAAALCLGSVWRYLLRHPEICADQKGKFCVLERMEMLAGYFGGSRIEDGADRFAGILEWLDLRRDFGMGQKEIDSIVDAVNVERLNNMPVPLGRRELYEIVSGVR